MDIFFLFFCFFFFLKENLVIIAFSAVVVIVGVQIYLRNEHIGYTATCIDYYNNIIIINKEIKYTIRVNCNRNFTL